MPGGTWAEKAMTTAMHTADVAVVVLSPEFVARRWPRKELFCFLTRTEKPLVDGTALPVIIPLFYRLSIQQLYDEPRLDRIDNTGNSLYRVSRFFERMESREPEANISNIKAALRKIHGAMGVENYVDASNDSTNRMLKRRNVLLNDLCDEVRNAIARSSQETNPDTAGPQPDDKGFRPQYHQEDSVSDLVLDFQEQCDSENPTTIEASILRALLDTIRGRSVISIQGIGGVGKTSILRGLSTIDLVNERFCHGIYLISLGADASLSVLVEAICKTVRVSGGENRLHKMRRESNWKGVFKHFRSWFARKDCLFMVDDLWETSELKSAVIQELLKLHLSGMSSKVLITTRSTEIASSAEKCFVLHPREPYDSRCRAILMLHSDTPIEDPGEEDTKAVTEILNSCSGLPLFLKLAGRAIRTLSFRHGGRGNIAYRLYSRTLAVSMQGLLNTDVDSYTHLASSLSVSIRLLEDGKERWGFAVHLSAAEMHRRLSVLEKQSCVPMKMLRYLWDLKSEAEATIVAREFGQMALATMSVKEAGSEFVEQLGVHDSLHEYALGETRKFGEETLGHKIVVNVYGRGLQREEGCRAWWSRRLEVDGYGHSHICHHLASAGSKNELVSLLLKPEWTVRSFEICRILDVERGYSLGMAVVRNIENVDCESCTVRDQRDEKAKEVETALQMVSGATRLALGYRTGNPRELCFQLYGRLQIFAEENSVIKEYLNRLEEKAEELWGPWLRCITSRMTPPGGAMSKIIHVNERIQCVAVSDDGDAIYCGTYHGRISVVDPKSGEVVKQFVHNIPPHFMDSGKIALPNWLSSISLCTYRNLLCSGSSDGSVHVWDAKTGLLLKIFDVGRKSWRDVRHLLAIGDGRLVVAACHDGTVQILDLESRRMLLVPLTEFCRSIVCMAILPDGKHIVSGGFDTRLRIWNAISGKQIGDALVGHDSCVTCVVVMPDGRHLVSGSADRTIRIWDIAKRTQVRSSFKGHVGSVTCVAVSRDGRRVASGSEDCTIRVWDAAPGREVYNTAKECLCPVFAIRFHPVDGTLISCSQSGTILIWNVSKTRVERRLDRHDNHVTMVTFTSDGMYVVSGPLDRSLRIWDVNSGQQVGNPLLGHSDIVTHIKVSPDDQLIVSVSRDKSVRVWDLKLRVLLRTFTGHTNEIDRLALTPSGSHALTSSADMIIWVWDLSMGEGGHFILNPHPEERNYIIPECGENESSIFVTDDGFRAVAAFQSYILVWNIKTRQLIKAWNTRILALFGYSRRRIMDLVGEIALPRYLDPISLNDRKIEYVEYDLDEILSDGVPSIY